MTNPLITSDPDVIGGQPRIAGTRISVATIMGWVNQGSSHAEIIEAYPTLTAEQIDAAIRYADLVDVSPMTNPVSQEEVLEAFALLFSDGGPLYCVSLSEEEMAARDIIRAALSEPVQKTHKLDSLQKVQASPDTVTVSREDLEQLLVNSARLYKWATIETEHDRLKAAISHPSPPVVSPHSEGEASLAQSCFKSILTSLECKWGSLPYHLKSSITIVEEALAKAALPTPSSAQSAYEIFGATVTNMTPDETKRLEGLLMDIAKQRGLPVAALPGDHPYKSIPAQAEVGLEWCGTSLVYNGVVIGQLDQQMLSDPPQWVARLGIGFERTSAVEGFMRGDSAGELIAISKAKDALEAAARSWLSPKDKGQ